MSFKLNFSARITSFLGFLQMLFKPQRHTFTEVAYVAGPYSGDVDANIRAARQVAIKLWEMGYAVITPHLNTAHMEQDSQVSYEQFVRGDLAIIHKCDLVVLLPGWQNSPGACREERFADEIGTPAYEWPDVPAPETKTTTILVSA